MSSPTPLHPGLCSITFRDLGAEHIADLAAKAGLSGIEWGSDVHVKPGDVVTAERVKRLCYDLGLSCPSYGSYARCEDVVQDAFDAVLDSAVALGAQTVRVWAGRQGSAEADSDHNCRVAETLHSHCEAASKRGLTVSLEWHRNTLTDTCESTLGLLDQVSHPALKSYWQRRDGQNFAEAGADVDALQGVLTHAHVFWWHDYTNRLPLADGDAFWRPMLAKLAQAPGYSARWGFIEFVRGDDEASFRDDAAAFLSLLGESTTREASQVG